MSRRGAGARRARSPQIGRPMQGARLQLGAFIEWRARVYALRRQIDRAQEDAGAQIDVFGDQRIGRGERGELEVEILVARRQGGDEQPREVDVVTDGRPRSLVDPGAAPFQDQRKEERIAGEAAQIATAGEGATDAMGVVVAQADAVERALLPRRRKFAVGHQTGPFVVFVSVLDWLRRTPRRRSTAARWLRRSRR